MTSEEIEAARAAALEERDRLQAELGELLMSGGENAKGAGSLKTKCQKAQAKLEEIDYAAAAISRAQEAAAKAATEREERQAQEELKRRLQNAHGDLEDIRRLAGNVDRALENLAQAMDELGGRMSDYAAQYSSLGIRSAGFFRGYDWCGQVLTLLKTNGAKPMRRYMAVANVRTTGKPGKAMADNIPDITAVLTGRDRPRSTGPHPV